MRPAPNSPNLNISRASSTQRPVSQDCAPAASGRPAARPEWSLDRPVDSGLLAALLAVLVGDHSSDDDDALDDFLVVRVDPQKGKARRHHAEDDGADHRAGDAPDAA